MPAAAAPEGGKKFVQRRRIVGGPVLLNGAAGILFFLRGCAFRFLRLFPERGGGIRFLINSGSIFGTVQSVPSPAAPSAETGIPVSAFSAP